jgi:hypothetical protein
MPFARIMRVYASPMEAEGRVHRQGLDGGAVVIVTG